MLLCMNPGVMYVVDNGPYSHLERDEFRLFTNQTSKAWLGVQYFHLDVP